MMTILGLLNAISLVMVLAVTISGIWWVTQGRR